MKIMMTKSQKAASSADGSTSMTFEAGKEYEPQGKWQEEIFKGFISRGVAHEIGGNAGPTETKKRGRPTKKS